ncbi:COX assembly mitochondrial protein homolog [Babylonia areolata]|uniref:COX assembly mitochondrial protein homolog n=1 Tax=Babylonia areolata TaxID=304850 RepID=UPI003FCFC518
MAEDKDKHVLKGGMGGGPLGLGDPEDKTLRNVEKEVMIPMKMKEKAKQEKCTLEVKEFGECAKEQGLLLPFMCRKVAKNLERCLSSWYQNPEFVAQCTQEYLEERSDYRRTGVKQKMKKKDAVIG